MLKVTHITAHLGGGVGNALSSILAYESENNCLHKHELILLDEPEKTQFIDKCTKKLVPVNVKPDEDQVFEKISASDIVIIHWWNHPIMASFLCSFPKVKVRVVLWSHVNGCNYPCIPFNFVNMVHKTFFTSPFSYENSLWSEKEKIKVKKSAIVVYGSGKIDFSKSVENLSSSSNDKFIIGYVGTLNRSKVHPDFVDYCYAVVKQVPSAYFVMVGDNDNIDDFHKKIVEYGIQDRFELTGYTNHVESELSRFDVFAYPLNPDHFGTTENALLEAMAYGLPVVVLNHNAEKYILSDDMSVGYLANNMNDYADYIKRLYDNPNLRNEIGRKAKKYVLKKFSFEKNVKKMRDALNNIVDMPKKILDFSLVFGSEPSDWFLACLGNDKQLFLDSLKRDHMCNMQNKVSIEDKIANCSPILREKNKSSIRHFAKIFPHDMNLQYWEKIIDGEK